MFQSKKKAHVYLVLTPNLTSTFETVSRFEHAFTFDPFAHDEYKRNAYVMQLDDFLEGIPADDEETYIIASTDPDFLIEVFSSVKANIKKDHTHCLIFKPDLPATEVEARLRRKHPITSSDPDVVQSILEKQQRIRDYMNEFDDSVTLLQVNLKPINDLIVQPIGLDTSERDFCSLIGNVTGLSLCPIGISTRDATSATSDGKGTPRSEQQGADGNSSETTILTSDALIFERTVKRLINFDSIRGSLLRPDDPDSDLSVAILNAAESSISTFATALSTAVTEAIDTDYSDGKKLAPKAGHLSNSDISAFMLGSKALISGAIGDAFNAMVKALCDVKGGVFSMIDYDLVASSLAADIFMVILRKTTSIVISDNIIYVVGGPEING